MRSTLGVLLTAALIAVAAAPAHATDAEADAIDTVLAVGTVATAASPPGSDPATADPAATPTATSGEEAPETAVVIDEQLGTLAVESDAPVEVTVPGQPVEAQSVGAADLASFDDGDVDYVLADPADGAAAAFAVIDEADDPTRFEFDITTQGDETELVLQESGAVFVYDELGQVVNGVMPAWAVDAAGTPVTTSYAVEGSTLVQTIELTGAEVFPVVADPTFSCKASTQCLITFNTKETAGIAVGGGVALPILAGACGSIPFAPAAAVCGLSVAAMLGSAVVVAASASAAGTCFGFWSKVGHGVWPVHATCLRSGR